MISFPPNISRTRLSPANISSASEIRNEPGELIADTCDHLRKRVPRADENRNKKILNINTSDCQIINKFHKIRTRFFGGHQPLKWKIMLILIVLEPNFDQNYSLRRSALCLHY